MKRIPIIISIVLLLLTTVFIGCEEIPELSEGFGIYDGSVELNGVYPGWEDTISLTIVNGNDKDRLFAISINSPSKVQDGFEAFPEEYFHWITIPETRIFIPAGETYQVPITLAIPSDMDYFNKHAEVRILVEDITQSDLVQVALEAKWFIITK